MESLSSDSLYSVRKHPQTTAVSSQYYRHAVRPATWTQLVQPITLHQHDIIFPVKNGRPTIHTVLCQQSAAHKARTFGGRGTCSHFVPGQYALHSRLYIHCLAFLYALQQLSLLISFKQHPFVCCAMCSCPRWEIPRWEMSVEMSGVISRERMSGSACGKSLRVAVMI